MNELDGLEVEGGPGAERVAVPLGRATLADVAERLRGCLVAGQARLLQALQHFFQHFDIRGVPETLLAL